LHFPIIIDLFSGYSPIQFPDFISKPIQANSVLPVEHGQTHIS